MTVITNHAIHYFQSEIVCHPDLVEMFLQNSRSNIHILPQAFLALRAALSDTFSLCWRHEAAAQGHQWQISGWNNDFRITFSGRSQDVLGNPNWRDNPFTYAQLRHLHSQHPYWYPGVVRLTTKTKNDPKLYCHYLSKFFTLVEQLGIQEFPRIMESAIDVYGDPHPLKQAVRLKHDDPLDFCHYRDDTYQPGGSSEGRHTEYSMRSTFQPRRDDDYRKQNRYHRALTCYHRPEHGFYRVELRLGYRYLNSFHESEPYHRAIESESVPFLERDYKALTPSRTLDLIGFIPHFVRTQLTYEAFDLEKLYKAHPVARYWHLKDKSVREIRYKLFRAGSTTKEVRRFTIKLPSPPMTFILPNQIKLHT